MEKSFYIHYKCSTCNKEHVGAPSFAFNAPAYYDSLSEEDKAKSLLSADRCSVLDTDYFIRTILKIPIVGTDEPFTWGVWVSQSKENFTYYDEHFKDDLTDRKTFGWFSSLLPEYESTLGLKSDVIFSSGGLRPHINLGESEHQLSIDFHHGISMERATEIAGAIMHKAEAGT